MKKQIMIRANIQALYLALSISLSSLPTFATLTPTDEQLFKAIEENKPEDVERLLSEEALVNVRDSFHNTPLHCAASYGHVKIVQLLLDKFASVEVRSHFHYTPLHLAAWHGHIKVVQLLLDKHASLNARDRAGCTPLHRTILTGHKEVIKLLMSKKANIEAQDNDGFTPLHTAITRDREVIVKVLLEAGANTNATNQKGERPLELAIDHAMDMDNPDLIQVLLSTGFKADVPALTHVLKSRFKEGSDTIIHMLLLQNPKLVSSKKSQELLALYSFDLSSFKKNKKRMDEHLKELAMFLEVRCSLPLVLGNLINEYHKSLTLYKDFFIPGEDESDDCFTPIEGTFFC